MTMWGVHRKSRRPRPTVAMLIAGVLAVPTAACTGSHRPATAHSPESARVICERHFGHVNATQELTVADARFAGGPTPTEGRQGPLDSYPDSDRVVRCLVPPTASTDAQVWDIVEPADRQYVRWSQGGDVTQIIPPT